MKPGIIVVWVTGLILFGPFMACGLTASPTPSPSSAASETLVFPTLPDTPTALGAALPQPTATAATTQPAAAEDNSLQQVAVSEPLNVSGTNEGLEPITAANADRIQLLATLGNTTTSYVNWAVSPDGLLFALNIADAQGKQQIEVQDVQTPAHVVFDGQGDTMWTAQFSPDGNFLASEWSTKDNGSAVELWNARSGAVWAVAFKEGWVSGLEFSPASSLLAALHGSGSPLAALQGGEITAWNVQTGMVEKVYSGEGESYTSFGFSPDGKLMVTAGKQTIDVWNTQTGTRQSTLGGNSQFALFSISANSRLLAALGQDAKQIKLWDLSTGQLKATLSGHTGDVRGFAFSPDSTLLASSGDSTLRLWDTQTGAAKAVLTGFDTYVEQAAFSPDGAYLATAEFAGGPVRLHNLRTGAVLLLSKRSLSYGPTPFAFSPDGSLLAVLNDKGVELSAVKLGKAVTQLPIFTAGLAGRLSFSPTETFVVYSPDPGNRAQLFGVVSSAAVRSGVKVVGITITDFEKVIPEGWLAVDPVPARYEINFDENKVDTLTCDYSGNHTLIHTRVDVTVTVTDLKTNAHIARRVFQGATATVCNQVENFPVNGPLTQTRYDLPDVGEFQTWVNETMGAYGFK